MIHEDRRPASGTQYTLESGDYTAVIASVGATLRVLRHASAPGAGDLVVPFDADEVRPYYRGATLAPWPNRVVDGRYRFGGREHVLPLTEPERGHALHGLAAWLDFDLVERADDHVILAAEIQPQAGYPWRLRIEVAYALGLDGLTQSVRATNLSPAAAPFGTGPHPYLVAGAGRVDDWTLELPARQVLAVTEDRLVPTELHPVDGAEAERFDFRAPRLIGSAMIDHAFADLESGPGGRVTVRVTDGQGRGVGMSWGSDCPWVQVHTADRPDEARTRLGLAVEPMTCPPDAFNSENALIILDPGESAAGTWSIFAI